MFEEFACTAAAAPRVRVAQPAADVWPDDSLTLVTAGHQTTETLHRLFPVALPYVDRAVVVDSGLAQGSWEYLTSLGPKVKALRLAADPLGEAVRQLVGGWFLLLGHDQLPSQPMLENLRKLIEASEGGQKFGSVEFLVNPVEVGEKVLAYGPREPRVPALFKWFPGMHIENGERLVGTRGGVAGCDHFIYLIK